MNLRIILFIGVFLGYFHWHSDVDANTFEPAQFARGIITICKEDADKEAKALKDSLANAEKGNVKAQVFVASHYRNEYKSHRKNSDSSLCIKWYTLTAENGSNEARRALAKIYNSDPLATDRLAYVRPAPMIAEWLQ